MCQTMSLRATPVAASGGRRCRRAFTLVEAGMATAVVGLALAGLLHAMAAGDQVNGYGRDLTSAAFLLGEMREYTLGLKFSDPDGSTAPGLDAGDGAADDIDDLMGASYSPPIDGSGAALTALADWRQALTIEWVDLDDFSQVVADGSSAVIRVTCVISRGNREITRAAWLKFSGGE